MKAAVAFLLALGCLALLPASVPASPPDPVGIRGFVSGDPAGSPAARIASSCGWRWKRKRVVRWVRRKHSARGRKGRRAKFRKVVRYRRFRVCVPVRPPPAPARLGVKAYEWGFTLSARSLRAGDTIVELSNRGEDDHNLHLEPLAGGEELFTPDLRPAEIARLRLDTTPGEYRLWCSLPTHAARGMDRTVTVLPPA